MIIEKNTSGFKKWKTFITSPVISETGAAVKIETEVLGNRIELHTKIQNSSGEEAASAVSIQNVEHMQKASVIRSNTDKLIRKNSFKK